MSGPAREPAAEGARPPEPDPDRPLAEQTRQAWLSFRARYEPLRPELYRYCRHLTASPWDAEDLVQETLMRALVMLGSQYGQEIRSPRAWLFRVASNAWLDRQRGRREVLALDEELERAAPASAAPAPDPSAQRAAAASLITRLSPQERVAFVLKDAFELTLEEIAAALATSPGAVKAALHRGRGKLGAAAEAAAELADAAAGEAAAAAAPARAAAPEAIAAFCAAFNAGDLAALTRTLLEAATVELPGVAVDLCLADSLDRQRGILYHALREPLGSGVPAPFLAGYLPRPPRAELRTHRGEPLLLLWYAHDHGEAVRSFLRFTLDRASGAIGRLRMYYYSPEALAELAAELAVPHRSNGYGF